MTDPLEHLKAEDREFFLRNGVTLPTSRDLVERRKKWLPSALVLVALTVVAFTGLLYGLIWIASVPPGPAEVARAKQEQAKAAEDAAVSTQQAKICAALLVLWNSPPDATNALQHVQASDGWNSECRN